MHYASNAVLAKARAMYAGHITGPEYDSLISCKSLPELISTLSRRKRYAAVLEKAPRDIRPEQAEELLRMSVYEQLSTLCRYEISGRKDFYKFYIVKRDIEQILRCVRLLISGRAYEYLTDLPPFFDKLTDLDLFGLAKAADFSDVLRVLEGTEYCRVLEPFLPIWRQEGVYLRMEAAFQEYLYRFLFDCIRRDRSDKKQTGEVLKLYLDSEFIIAMYRLKKLHTGDEKIYEAYLRRDCTALTKSQIAALTGAADEKELMRALSDTVYAQDLKGLDLGDTEKVMADFLCKKMIKGLRYYTDPAAVMICYMYLCENEIRNIVRIIEGIRYGIAPERIREVLTGMETQ